VVASRLTEWALCPGLSFLDFANSKRRAHSSVAGTVGTRSHVGLRQEVCNPSRAIIFELALARCGGRRARAARELLRACNRRVGHDVGVDMSHRDASGEQVEDRYHSADPVAAMLWFAELVLRLVWT
jgi:hypothetical protein